MFLRSDGIQWNDDIQWYTVPANRDLDIRIEPEAVVVPPGGEAVAQLRVRQRRRMLTGPAQAYHFFSLAVLPSGEAAALPLLQLPCEVRIAPPLAFLSRCMPVLVPPAGAS